MITTDPRNNNPEAHPMCTMVRTAANRPAWVLPNGLVIARHPGAAWIFDVWMSLEGLNVGAGLLLTGERDLDLAIEYALDQKGPFED